MENEYDITWEDAAIKALKRIYKYLAKSNSKQAAVHIRKELVTLANTLRKFPDGHPLEPALRKRPEKFRFVKKWNYKLIFSVRESQVIIHYVFHIKQNPDKLIEAIE